MLSLRISKIADNIEVIIVTGGDIIECLTDDPYSKTAKISDLIVLSDRRTRELLKKMIDDGLL